MKKAILFLVVYVALFNVVGPGFHNLAFASNYLTISSDGVMTTTAQDGWGITFYDSGGGSQPANTLQDYLPASSFPQNLSDYGFNSYTDMSYIVNKSNVCMSLSYSDCLANNSTVESGHFNGVNYTGIIGDNFGSLSSGSLGIKILGGSVNGTGGKPLQGSDMTANVESALQATGSGLFPIVAVVVGIFLTFLVANELKKMFKDGVNSDNKKSLIVEKPLRHKTAIYNKDGRFAGYTFDD